MSTSASKLFSLLQRDSFDIAYINLIDQKHLELTKLISTFKPDLMIGFGYRAALSLKRAAPDKKLILFATDCQQMRDALAQNKAKDYISHRKFLMKPWKRPQVLCKEEKEAVEITDLIVTNSNSVLFLYQKYFPFHAGKIYLEPVWFAEWIYADALQWSHHSKPFGEREVDALFLASSWKHVEKNYNMVREIVRKARGMRIHVAGETEEEIAGAVHYGLIRDREKLFALMGNTKTVVCPSLFDAAPGILYEASALGCNVVASENCGISRLCNENVIVKEFSASGFIEKINLAVSKPFKDNVQQFLACNSYKNFKETVLAFCPDPESGETIKMADRFPIRQVPHVFSSKKWIPAEKDSIAYYLWRFPVLSQTFIHRELDALKRSGVRLIIVAEGTDRAENADAKARALLQDTCYVNHADKAQVSAYRKYFWRTKPFTCLKILLFLITHRCTRFKSLHKDRKVFMKALCLAGSLKEKNVRRIHTPWADETALVALLASRLLGCRYSVQVRAHELYRSQYQYGLKEKLVNADLVITNTLYNQLHLKALVNGKSRVLQIYNGLDLQNFIAPEDRPHHNPLRIVCTARLIEQKGIEYLLKSCRKLKDSGYRFCCRIMGGPEPSLYSNYYLMLRKMHSQLGLEETVFFADEQPFEAVLDSYRTADLFVLPSVIASDGSRDIIPNVLLEAMAMKLPVISTHVGGIPEIVEDGVSGLLVVPADENALTQAIARLLDDPLLRKSLGENARKRVEQQFDIEKNIAEYLRAFAAD